MNSKRVNLKPYLFIFLLFVIDIVAFNFLEKQLICALLCLYIVQITRPLKAGHVLLSTLLLFIESSLYYGRFGLQFIYLTPLLLIGLSMQKTFYKSKLYPYLLLIIALLCATVVEYFILGLSVSLSYTISQILVNIGMLWILSLTYK